MTTIADWYAEVASTPTDIVDHIPTFVKLAQDATKVIELGVRGGNSTVGWLFGLEGHGHLWSVDITPPARDIGTYDHWTFISGHDCNPIVLDQLPTEVDIVFIDTSHAYDHTLRELNLYVPRVRAGGLVLLHDTEVRSPDGIGDMPPYPVRAAIEAYCDEHAPLAWSNDPRCYGLGTIYLPGAQS